MNIIQYNIRGLFNNFEDLEILERDLEVDIFCLQETKLKKSDKPTHAKYNIISNHNESMSATQGVAILIKKHISFTTITLHTSLQAIAIKTRIPFECTIVSIYLHPNLRLHEAQLQAIINQIQPPFILLGDFNAHNPIWGSLSYNTKGRAIEQIILDNQLFLVNDGNHTYSHPGTGTNSCIDLTIASTNIATKLKYKVQPPHLSDHRPILITTKKRVSESIENPTINTNKTNWARFQFILGNKTIAEESNINDRVVEFTKTVLEAITESSPSPNYSSGKTPVPWWSQELNTLLKTKNKAFRTFARSPTSTNLADYRLAKNTFRNCVKSSKKQTWHSFIQGINANTNPREYWKAISKMNGDHTAPRLITILDDIGEQISDNVVICNSLAKTFVGTINPAHTIAKNNLERAYNNKATPMTYTMAQINSPITSHELYNNLKYTKIHTAPGVDQISYLIIKNLPGNFSSYLLNIYNTIYMSGQYPDSWKVAKISPILKKDKDHFNPKSYRPISLLSCLSKLLEKIICNRISFWLDTESLLSRTQLGFRKGMGTTDAITKLHDYVVESLNNKEHVDCIALDMTGAYDNCWHQIILSKLSSWGMAGNIFKTLESFLKDRQLFVHANNELSETYNLHQGIPQGSPLSATLFTVAINGLAEILTATPDLELTIYADDIIIFARSKKTDQPRNPQIQSALDIMREWCSKRGFSIAPTKSQHIHFCRFYRNCVPLSFNIGNTPIPSSNLFKYLGVLFDSKINFTTHIDNTKTNCIKRLQILKCLAGRTWGCNQEQLINIGNCLIRSKLEYASQVIMNTNKKNIYKLTVVYNTFLRVATGALRTSAIERLYKQANTTSLRCRFQILAIRQAIKIKTNSAHILHHLIKPYTPGRRIKTGIQNALELLTENGIDIANLTNHNIRPLNPILNIKLQVDTSLKYKCNKVETPAEILKALSLEKIDMYKDYTQYFTDGSKTINGCGFAIYNKNTTQSEKVKIHDEASIFTAESMAINRAVDQLKDVNNKIVIFSDSLSVLESLKNIENKHAIVNNTQIGLQQNNNIKVAWVPAHVGAVGNETADRLAKRSIVDPDCVENGWICADTVRYMEKTLGHPGRTNRNKKYFLDRARQVIVNRLTIGHTKLTHLYLLNKSPQPGCVHCQTKVSVRHWFLECEEPTRANLRRTFFGNSTLEEILNIVSLEQYNVVVEFLNKIGIDIKDI